MIDEYCVILDHEGGIDGDNCWIEEEVCKVVRLLTFRFV